MGSLNAAYDYRAFGEQVNLNLPTDKVTENFTGKELDDETELGYWGARYLDQTLQDYTFNLNIDPSDKTLFKYGYGMTDAFIFKTKQ